MSQLRALVWLKWTLFRNSLRSKKAVAGRVASVLGTVVALAFALVVAAGLGTLAYFLTSPDAAVRGLAQAGAASSRSPVSAGAGYILLFTVFASLYLMWALVPLGMGGGNQFDPGRMLLYPVSLRKLFALDFLSDLTSLASIFAVPVVFAVALGAGLAQGQVLGALLVALFAVAFGMSLVKLLASSVHSLMRKRRARGETLLAVFGALAGLFGAFFGQIFQRVAPYVARNENLLDKFWWTPPGAVTLGLVKGLREGGAFVYTLALATLAAYTCLFVAAAYWVARRGALGVGGGAKRAAVGSVEKKSDASLEDAAGWRLPFVPDEVSAIVEKELRYVMRNAQVRLLVLMPLILIGVRVMQQQRAFPEEDWRGLPGGAAASWYAEAFALYGEGLVQAGGVLYVFMVLAGLACNSFAFEDGGMRAFVLSPVARRKILLAKNLTLVCVALVFTTFLLAVNQLLFRDLTPGALAFVALCFALFAPALALVGNSLSMRFPKRMEFGKRMNLSGVAGLLLLPIILALALPPLASVAAGFYARSLPVKYATLAGFALIAVLFYFLLIGAQGRLLARREIEILEAVKGKDEG